MNIGVVRWALGYGLLAVAAGASACGGSDERTCGTAQSPVAIEVKDVSPAVNASVANSAIVQTFTLVGQHLHIDPNNLVLPAAHTAGLTIPTQVAWSISLIGADTVYTSEPFSWQKAPAHVEIESAGAMETPDHCALALPKQLFKYDVTMP